mgnify:CR=1 FL=1
MRQFFKKGETVLVAGNKYEVREIIKEANGNIHYALKGNSDVIPQERVKKYYRAASAKFCKSWQKAFIK